MLSRRAAALSIVLLPLASGCSSGADPSSGGDASSRSSSNLLPEDVAQRMLDKYRSARSYADSASYVQHYAIRGEGVERERPFFELSLAFERPNRLRLTLTESIPGERAGQSYDVASDGRELRVAVGAMPEQLLAAPAPETLTADNFLPDPLLRDSLLSQTLGNVFPQLAMLLNASDDELVFPDDGPPRFLPSKSLDDRAYYRVATTSPAGERVLWIDQQNYTLRRMDLPIAAQQEELDPSGQYMEHGVRIDFRDPTFDAMIDDASFEMPTPEDATLVTKFTPPPPEGPPALLGQYVGATSFYDADGDRLQLDEYAGKILVLDFWQFDCPPCRQQAALLEEVREIVGDDAEIEFIGVNVDRAGTPAAMIGRTWDSWGGEFAWLADRDGRSRDSLAIRATPTLVVLDGQSCVQLLRPGLLADAAELRAVLDELLAGKNLAAEARAAYEARLAEYRRAIEANRWRPD